MIKSKLEKNEDYGIVGYSYGSILATEIYKELEKLGHKGRCLFIDGSPSLIKKLVNEQFSVTDEITSNIIESKLLVHLLSMFVSENITNILVSLSILDNILLIKLPLFSITYIQKLCLSLQ